MARPKRVVTTAGDLVRKFGHYNDLARTTPVIVTKNGRPSSVLISVTEYERLKQRDQQAFLAADTPERFLADIEAIAGGKAA